MQVQEQLSTLAEKIQSLNLVLAIPELEAVERDVLSRALWDALDEEAELYNQLSSLSSPQPQPEPVIEQVKPEPETVTVEDVQKEDEASKAEQPDPVPTYVIEQVQTDIKQYTEQLEVFDKAIETQAFAELPEHEQARRLRARDHLAGYLEESKAELESFGPLFDELNELEPVEQLEQELEQQNGPDLASDFDVLFSDDPVPASINADPVSTADELADLQAKVSQAKALAEKNHQLQSEKAVIESELSDLERQIEQIFSGGYTEIADIEAAKIQREIEVRQRCRREIMAHFESPDSIVPAWAKWQDRIDELTPSPEPEVLEPAKPKKPTQKKLKRAIVKILKNASSRRAELNHLKVILNNEPWLFDAQEDFIQAHIDELLTDGLIESVESTSGTVWLLPALPASRKLKAPPEIEPEALNPDQLSESMSLGEFILNKIGESKPDLLPKPAVKPVKVDQIGSVSPTRGQLSEAVLEILSREPHFASREMLDLALPGSPWLFDVNTPNTREMLTGVLSGLMDNGVIEFFSTENGLFLRLATLSTPSEPEQSDDNPKCHFCNSPAKETPGQLLWKCTKNEAHYFYVGDKNGVWRNAENKDIESVTVPLPVWTKSAVPHKFDPRCEYCNGDMQAINGNPGQWRCLGNIYHSFYVSNGRGVWVDNSGTFDKQITDLPSWAKKEG